VTVVFCSGAVLSAENAGGDTGATTTAVTILSKPRRRGSIIAFVL
jgi:hypothetical protein